MLKDFVSNSKHHKIVMNYINLTVSIPDSNWLVQRILKGKLKLWQKKWHEVIQSLLQAIVATVQY